MSYDTLPPFVTFLLPTPRFRSRNFESSSQVNSAPGLSGYLVSKASSAEESSLTVSTFEVSTSPTDSKSLGDTKITEASSPCPTTYLTRRQPSTLKCLKCSTDLAYTTQILSKGFTGRLGRAYLVAPPPPPPYVPSFPPKPRPKAELVNTRTERSISRELMTGWHVVADVSCIVCSTVVGWKYIDTREESQRYKIGKIILERQRVCTFDSWEEEEIKDCEERTNDAEMLGKWGRRDSDSSIQFDSNNEEECESLFSGVWDRDLVARRRKIKRSANKETGKKDNSVLPPTSIESPT